MAQHVVVIGAGIVGVSTAIWLQRAGVQVTLIDREGPAAGASQGNGGVLANIAVVPVTTPGLARRAPAMLFDPDQPLFLRWRYLPKLAPFLRHYMKASKDDRVQATSKALAQLLHDAPDQHHALAAETGAEKYIRRGAYLFGYPSKSVFEADGYAWQVRKARGYAWREVDGEALGEIDPALRGRFGWGIICDHHGQITDPGAYVRALASSFEAAGGTLSTATVAAFKESQGTALAVATDQGPVSADAFVLSTGAWSSPLARSVGVDVPLESERGYHVEFHNPSFTLRAPIMVAKGKFVVTPMDGRIRAAGVVEFGGLDAPPSKAPFDLLRRQMAELFPDLTYSHTTEWMGHRPAPADSIPVIGKSPRLNNVFLGFGHHHIGLTGGPKTGRWLAQMVTGAPGNEDLSLYSPSRRF